VLTDVEVVGVADVDAGNTHATEVFHGLDALVDDLAGVGLEANCQFDSVSPALGVFTSNTLEGDVGTTAVAHLLQLCDDALAATKLSEVDSLDSGIPLLDEVQTPVLVNHDHSRGLVHQSELGTHLANGSCTPNGNNIALVDASVDNAVPAGADHIRQVQALLIRNIVGELEKVVVAVGYASVLGLATGKATREVRVSEHACGPAAVHGVLNGVGVGALALRRLLLLAVVALAASDLETCDHTVAFLQVLDTRAHLVHDAAELVAQDVALLQLNNSAMVKVQVATTDGASSDLEDHVAVLEDLGFGAVDCYKLR